MARNTLKCNHMTPVGLKGLIGTLYGLDRRSKKFLLKKTTHHPPTWQQTSRLWRHGIMGLQPQSY